MVFLFLPNLLLGSLVNLILYVSPKINTYSKFVNDLYNSGIATITINFLLLGIFEIAGTSSSYTVLYTVIGLILIVLSIVLFIFECLKQNKL